VNVEAEKLMLAYSRSFLFQTCCTVLANACGSLEQRLARWLLMCQDRLGSEDIILTQEFISIMLAVRRAGVTAALERLRKRGLLQTTRGRVRILQRSKLKEIAGDYYGKPEAEYDRLLGLATSTPVASSFGITTMVPA
jgi:hypothetical protein